jgi:hypothetical protein
MVKMRDKMLAKPLSLKLLKSCSFFDAPVGLRK